MPTEKRQRKREGRLARQEELRAQQRRARRRSLVVRVVAAVAVVVLAAALFARGGDDGEEVSTEATTTTTAAGEAGSAACPPADGSAERRTEFDGPPKMCIDTANTYAATIETDVGVFTVALDAKKAPRTVNNFVFLARYHFFEGLPFHRVIPDFVVQGGDPEGTGRGGPGYQFADELPESVSEYKAGSVAMANSGPNTNGSQFFVVVSDSGGQQLSVPNYSLFGQVTEGMDVVKRIEADGGPPPDGTPKVVHKMTKVTITES